MIHLTPSLSPDRRTMRLALGEDAEPLFWTLLPPLRPDPEAARMFEEGFADGLSADFAMLAGMPLGMAAGRDVHVHGEVCPILLSNLEGFMRYREMWSGGGERRVGLSADRVRHRGGHDPESPHVMALSGGVDSTFALAKNFAEDNGHRRRPLAAGMLVRGFDYPVGASDGFDALAGRIGRIGARHGIAPVLMETNWRDVLRRRGASWESFHIAGIAACLHLLAGRFGGALFAADFSYVEDRKMLAWGSNSVTNGMLSSGAFPVEPRGAEASRSEKIRLIHAEGLFGDVSVCWSGPRTGGNCGKCTKCRRAMAMCYAQDLDYGDAFPDEPPSLRDALRTKIHTPTSQVFTRDLIANWTTPRKRWLRTVWRARLALSPAEVAAYRSWKAWKR